MYLLKSTKLTQELENWPFIKVFIEVRTKKKQYFYFIKSGLESGDKT